MSNKKSLTNFLERVNIYERTTSFVVDSVDIRAEH